MDHPTAELRAIPQEHARHLVQLYETDAFLVRVVSDFLEAGMRAGEGVVVIATEAHREALLHELASRKVDIQRARLAGTLLVLDAGQTLEEFMVDELPDQARFEAVVGAAVARAGAGGERHVRAFGEMVDLLWRDGRREAALRLEDFWNDLAQAQDFTLLCAYTMDSFYKDDGLPAVLTRHGHLLPPDAAVRGVDSGGGDRVRELVAEVSQRKQVEEALRASLLDLRRAELAARRSEAELKDFAERAVFGLQWVDQEGEILWANQAQLDMLGYRRDEYVGQKLMELQVGEPAASALLDRLAREEVVHDFEARLRGRDGSIRDVLISANTFRRDGRVAYYRCFTRDVTERKRVDAERARLVAELEQTVHLNEMFTAILGHDLRNPLNAVMTSIELGLRRATEEPLQRTLRRALGSTKRMAEMISQLLDFTRARAGGLPLERQPLSLHALVEEVRAEVELAYPDRMIEIRSEGDPRGRWDRTRLTQAISNLIGNAAQHGQEGSPVTVHLDGTSELTVKVEISNRGTIPPDLLPHIFKPFRGADRRQDRTRGLGLGLYITEQVVRAHRGEISVLSTEAAGTRFTLWLPRGGDSSVPFAPRPPQPETRPPPTSPAPGPRPEQQLQMLVNSIRDYAIFMLDTQGLVRSWNPGAEHVLGYAPQEIIGRHFSTFYRLEDATSGRWERELEVAQVNGHFEEEGWRVRKDGSHIWANVILTPVRDASGVLVGFAKVTRDLTERKLAEEMLRQEQERFRLMVASVKDYAIFMLDPVGRVATWNAGAERIKGYRAEDIIGQHFSRFYPPADVLAGKPDMELEVAAREGRFEEEGWRLRKDGSRFWANVVITALRDPSGRLTGFGKVTRDLTKQHAASEARRPR